MRKVFILPALLLAMAVARADIAPTPDAGPFSLSVAGLEFQIQPVVVKYPPGYTKTFQVAVLTGCQAGHRNCTLARRKNLIGMEVNSVNGASLRPEEGQLHQIGEAFKKGDAALELYRRQGGITVTVSFAAH